MPLDNNHPTFKASVQKQPMFFYKGLRVNLTTRFFSVAFVKSVADLSHS